jgi:hypothetical protein
MTALMYRHLVYGVLFLLIPTNADNPSIYFKVETLISQVVAGDTFQVQVTTGLPFCRGVPPLFSIVFNRQITYKSPYVDPTKTGILADCRITSCNAGTYELKAVVTIAGDYQQAVFFYAELFDGDITTQGECFEFVCYMTFFFLRRKSHVCPTQFYCFHSHV